MVDKQKMHHDPLVDLIRSSTSSSDEAQVQRIKNAVLQERANVLARRGRLRRYMSVAGAAAAVVLLGVGIFWGVAGRLPFTTQKDVAKTKQPGSVCSPKDDQALALRTAIEDTLQDLAAKKGKACERRARRAVARLSLRSGKAADIIQSFVAEQGNAAEREKRIKPAVMLLAAMDTPAADDTAVQIIAGIQSQHLLDKALEGLVAMEPQRLLVRLLGLPETGAKVMAGLGKSDPAMTARLFWRTFKKDAEKTENLVRNLARSFPDQDAAFIRALLRAPEKSQMALVRKLGNTGNPRAWPVIKAVMAQSGPSPMVLCACGDIGATDAVPVLEKYIECADPRGAAAIASLGKIPAEEAVQALLAVKFGRRGPAPFTARGRAIDQSLKQHGLLAVNALARVVHHGPSRQIALQVLMEVFPEHAVAALCDLLPRVPRNNRAAIMGALGRLGNPDAAVALIPLLDDPESARVVHRILVQIVGRDYGRRAREWKAWWRHHLKKSNRNVFFHACTGKGGIS